MLRINVKIADTLCMPFVVDENLTSSELTSFLKCLHFVKSDGIPYHNASTIDDDIPLSSLLQTANESITGINIDYYSYTLDNSKLPPSKSGWCCCPNSNVLQHFFLDKVLQSSKLQECMEFKEEIEIYLANVIGNHHPKEFDSLIESLNDNFKVTLGKCLDVDSIKFGSSLEFLLIHAAFFYLQAKIAMKEDAGPDELILYSNMAFQNYFIKNSSSFEVFFRVLHRYFGIEFQKDEVLTTQDLIYHRLFPVAFDFSNRVPGYMQFWAARLILLILIPASKFNLMKSFDNPEFQNSFKTEDQVIRGLKDRISIVEDEWGQGVLSSYPQTRAYSDPVTDIKIVKEFQRNCLQSSYPPVIYIGLECVTLLLSGDKEAGDNVFEFLPSLPSFGTNALFETAIFAAAESIMAPISLEEMSDETQDDMQIYRKRFMKLIPVIQHYFGRTPFEVECAPQYSEELSKILILSYFHTIKDGMKGKYEYYLHFVLKITYLELENTVKTMSALPSSFSELLKNSLHTYLTKFTKLSDIRTIVTNLLENRFVTDSQVVVSVCKSYFWIDILPLYSRERITVLLSIIGKYFTMSRMMNYDSATVAHSSPIAIGDCERMMYETLKDLGWVAIDEYLYNFPIPDFVQPECPFKKVGLVMFDFGERIEKYYRFRLNYDRTCDIDELEV